jgi:predicted  nucleic acid-binding Zn-ribbon protein
MIIALTKQYKSMEEDFEATSTTLLNVGKDTKALVSDGSKLEKIINALNAVMVEDQRFIEIVSNLNTTAELNKTSMTEFKDAQSSLNDWVKKQRNFVDAVQALMKQLEDISKINDYSKEFWKNTRSGMNDSLGVIQQGSKSLMQQIENLDGHFYTRLNTTLANLDQCIQKMIDNA